MFGTAFLGPTSGSAVNAAVVEAFSGMASVAAGVGDSNSANKWTSLATSVKKALNTLLWSEKYGVYSLEQADPGNYSIAALGFAITSGTANLTQAQRALSHLPSLKLGPGYRDSSKVASSDSTANLSPNKNGFLLSALLQQKQAAPAAFLLKNLWGAMIGNESTNSGASWEYVNQNSEPGLGQYTSLSHPWGGAATYALTNYVAGIRPTSFGYRTWVVEPAYAGLGLDYVNTTVPTPHGALSVAWTVKDSVVAAEIRAPANTSGRFILSKEWACAGDSVSLDCEKLHDFVYEITGGEEVHHIKYRLEA
ncbi:unnamed protein product [Penicillium salamii]|nr:unnamed protein product [Penicillium salamii]CAG8320795.1 unnamed protein product [Penicillium salamii]